MSPLLLLLQRAGIAQELDGFIGGGPLPGKVEVPGYIDVRGKNLIWQWLDPDSSGKGYDFNKVLPMVIHIPRDHDTPDWPDDFLKKERPYQSDTTGMLDAFVRITGATSALRFAKKYGMLQICRHGLPYSHAPACLASSQRSGWNPEWREPLEGWFHQAKRARAILGLSAAIQIGDERAPVGSKDDWTFLYERREGKASIDELMQDFIAKPSLAKNFLASDINNWLVEGNVRPTISWGEEEALGFSLNASTFGLLGVQLMTAASRVQDVYFCDGCGNPYSRKKRKPQAGRHQYCEACGEQAASKNRQARYRQKERDKSNAEGIGGKI